MNKILAAWHWDGPVSEPVPYGEGHINQTYAITVTSEQGAKRYILQKINTNTFKDPDGLMENICGVTDFLREKAKQRGADPERATLHVALTKAGKPYYKAADGGCWRVYDFVENTVCLQQVQSAEDFYQSAVAFGNFQHQLADYPANTLHETIPHFHDTPKRFADFQRAVAEDRMGRAAQVQREIEFVRAREAEYSGLISEIRLASARASASGSSVPKIIRSALTPSKRQRRCKASREIPDVHHAQWHSGDSASCQAFLRACPAYSPPVLLPFEYCRRFQY